MPGNAPFPTGNPVPGHFNIWIEGNVATDKHVLIEWLDANSAVLCQQFVATPCPFEQDVFDTAALQTNLLSACSCVGTTISADPDSLDSTEPADVEAELGTPVQIGYNTWLIPNLSAIDPPNATVLTNITLEVEDDDGVAQVVTLPTTFDPQGNIIVMVPGGSGSYTLTLDITSKACGTNDDDGDFDSASFKTDSTTADFTYTQQDCTPAHFDFTDATVPDPGWSIVPGSEQWTIYGFDGTTVLITGSGSPYGYTFATVPTGSQAYTVHMTVTETGPDPGHPGQTIMQ